MAKTTTSLELPSLIDPEDCYDEVWLQGLLESVGGLVEPWCESDDGPRVSRRAREFASEQLRAQLGRLSENMECLIEEPAPSEIFAKVLGEQFSSPVVRKLSTPTNILRHAELATGVHLVNAGYEDLDGFLSMGRGNTAFDVARGRLREHFPRFFENLVAVRMDGENPSPVINDYFFGSVSPFCERGAGATYSPAVRQEGMDYKKVLDAMVRLGYIKLANLCSGETGRGEVRDRWSGRRTRRGVNSRDD